METVYVNMTKAEVLQRLRSIPSVAAASSSVLTLAGHAALDRVVSAFGVKSRGGTDEAGDRWAPLAPSTVAKRLRKQRPTSSADRPSSALTPLQRESWWNAYRSALYRFKDKGTAARMAWARVKRKGAQSLYDKYGASGVDILRDTSALMDSLIGGTPDTVFRVGPGSVTIGTRRKGALAHHLGGSRLPQRRLWPHPSKWPSAWWYDVLDGARIGVVQLIAGMLR